MTRYKRRTDGEGFTVPCGVVYRIACCGCELVHDFVFVSEDGKPIGVAARRNERATGQKRRHAKKRPNVIGLRRLFEKREGKDMNVYERICLHDWHVEAANGDRQDCTRGKTYTTSEPHDDGTVTVLSRFWVRAPESIFEPFENCVALGEARKTPNVRVQPKTPAEPK